MNYIKQINAFYDWLETNSMSTSAIALWFALMHMCNKTGWATEFAVATSVLSVKTGLSTRSISNARNELKQKGRIDWRSRRGNQSAMYSIIPFPEKMSAYNSDNVSNSNLTEHLSAINADNTSGNISGNTSNNDSGNASTLNKQNKTKENDDDVNNPFAYYSKNIGPLVPDIADLIAQYQKDLPDELITEALRLTVRNNVRSFRYAEKIILSWLDKGIKNIDDYLRYEQEREHKRYQEKTCFETEQMDPDRRTYSQEEIEGAAKYIEKAVKRYSLENGREVEDIFEYVQSLGYPEELTDKALQWIKKNSDIREMVAV